MKSRQLGRLRRRTRLLLGAVVICAVASGELWMAGQFVQGFGRSANPSAAPFQAPHLARLFLDSSAPMSVPAGAQLSARSPL